MPDDVDLGKGIFFTIQTGGLYLINQQCAIGTVRIVHKNTIFLTSTLKCLSHADKFKPDLQILSANLKKESAENNSMKKNNQGFLLEYY